MIVSELSDEEVDTLEQEIQKEYDRRKLPNIDLTTLTCAELKKFGF